MKQYRCDSQLLNCVSHVTKNYASISSMFSKLRRLSSTKQRRKTKVFLKPNFGDVGSTFR